MNKEQKHAIETAEGKVRQIRRTLEELSTFGWVATETTKPLEVFDTYCGRLSLNQANIQETSPLDKDKQELSSLLSEENLLVESIGKLAEETAAALRDEELSFFQAREGTLSDITTQTEEADDQIRQALSWLVEGLQRRWSLMQKRQRLAERFEAISQAHKVESFGAAAVQWPKPFPKMNRNSWGAFITSFLGRLSAVLANMETASPADAVRTIYEKPNV